MGIGDDQVALGGDRQATGAVDVGLAARPTVTGVAGQPRAYDGVDVAVAEVHTTDAVVARVGDVQVVLAAERDAAGSRDQRVDGGALVASIAIDAGPEIGRAS